MQLYGTISAERPLLVVALELEAVALRDLGLPLLVTGAGKVNAAVAVATAINTARPRELINLGTAFLAASVIGLFEASISKVVALAVLMPICASMGGNAGTQALTVAVRALATGQLTAANALRIVVKEGIVGSLNGFLFATLTGLAAWLWFRDPTIGLCIGAAMMINLIVAGVAGVTTPIVLDRLGIDPAPSSAVILTTVTDVTGFFSFLGLATLFVL